MMCRQFITCIPRAAPTMSIWISFAVITVSFVVSWGSPGPMPAGPATVVRVRRWGAAAGASP